MEHGRLVELNYDFCHDPCVTVKYEGRYLFLSLANLNRIDEFVSIVTIDEYKDLYMNVKDLMIPDIVENHIEECGYDTTLVEEYRSGLILRDKYTEKLYSIVITNRGDDYTYFLIDLYTFELQDIRKKVGGRHSEYQWEYVKGKYDTYSFRFCDLPIRINKRR